MNECDRFPEGSTHRAVCRGEVRTLEHCNFHRARWGLAPLESLPVRPVSVAPNPQKPAKRGWGDMLSGVLSAFGITEERVSKAIGKPCGCAKRREALNEIGRRITG